LVLRLENTVFNFGFQAVHIARRRASEQSALRRKHAKMAGANEFLFFFNPRNGTSQVSADCRQDNQFALGVFADVNRFLCDGPAPAIPLLGFGASDRPDEMAVAAFKVAGLALKSA